MKKTISIFKILFVAFLTLGFFIWLFLSTFLPINYFLIKSDFINELHSYTFFITLVGFILNTVTTKVGRENTMHYFKKFMNKEKVVKEKKLPNPDCGCKKK
jgi:uncharacterized protein YacL